MRRAVRRLRCKIRRHHRVTCEILILQPEQMERHTHTCLDCDAVPLAVIQPVDPQIQQLLDRVMGQFLPDYVEPHATPEPKEFVH